MLDRRFLDISLIVNGIVNEPDSIPTTGTHLQELLKTLLRILLQAITGRRGALFLLEQTSLKLKS